jgi:hypothetical protein
VVSFQYLTRSLKAALFSSTIVVIAFMNCSHPMLSTNRCATGSTADPSCGGLASIEAAGSASAEAVQTIYQNGVPHTDRTGHMMFDYKEGSSFFPIWMYGMKHPRTAYLCHPDEASKAWVSPEDPRVSNIALLKEGGFNAAQFIGEGDYSEIFLKEVEREGLQALMYWKPLDRGLDAEPTIKTFLQNYGDHPNLLGIVPTEEVGRYFSFYQDASHTATMEANMNQWIDFHSTVRAQIKALTSRPVFTIDNLWLANQTELSANNHDLQTWRAWNDRSDIIALDNYPQSLPKLQTFDYSRGISRMGDFVQRTYAEQKPFWALVNAYEEVPAAGAPKIAEFPSPAQMRAMIYSSIVGGATGVGYFIFDDYASRKSRMIGIRPDTPPAYLLQGMCADPIWSDMLVISEEKAQQSRELWQAVSTINHELQEISPAILSKTSRSPYRVLLLGPKISPTPIRTILKEYRNDLYLIAVNLDRARLDVTFEQSDSIPGSTVEVMFEKRNVSVDARPNAKVSFTDTFGEFDVHVYRWSGK